MNTRQGARPGRRRGAAILAASVMTGLALLTAGCETVGYYAQSIGGHLGVMAQAQPLNDAIAGARDANDARLAQRLALAGRIRDYASRELKLPDNGSYRRYANLHRPYVVWSVFATPELSMELRKWCFPIVGCISYRGYYAQDDAEQYAQGLRRDGLEAYVAGIPAYSTLGYFDDPLLNTFVYLPEGELARLIFHELAHQVVYVRNDTAFNESFATAVEAAGVERWLAEDASEDARTSYRQYDARRQQFRALLLGTRDRLAALYQTPLDGEAKREGKARIFADMREQYARLKLEWGNYSGYDRWFDQPLTNAHLAAVATYQQWVPAFTALLAQCDGDWRRFYAEAGRIGALPAAEREATLRRLAPPATRVDTLTASGTAAGPD
ncbi:MULTISPECIES: aminopeptidase [unclassified Cupriavidus]|uniref:aminopeptidase n=1 Tax=unclassified Cupriavidus TaxID=2640874 RepID=UPI000428DCA8|nr:MULTISPECIES: aminopeptidase [unclassified Cupriavidus]MBP0638180.1 aminopeptidase [Cupriavidus sp. AcVe19-6a]